MGKRSKSVGTASEPGLVGESKRVKNKKIKPECSDTNNESKPEETVLNSEDQQVKRKKKNKSESTEGGNEYQNKKIIFSDDDNEPIEVNNPVPVQRKRTNQGESSHENEEDIKDEDIDKFCDGLNEEDNEQYENWVQLIEAKLNSNKKKPK